MWTKQESTSDEVGGGSSNKETIVLPTVFQYIANESYENKVCKNYTHTILMDSSIIDKTIKHLDYLFSENNSEKSIICFD